MGRGLPDRARHMAETEAECARRLEQARVKTYATPPGASLKAEAMEREARNSGRPLQKRGS